MTSILKLPDVWRVLKEVDLESIRRDALGRFRILVLADAIEPARAAAALLSGEEAPHPWVEPRTPGGTGAGPDEAATLTAAVALTFDDALTPALAQAIAALHRARVPVVTAVIAGGRRIHAVARAGENARILVSALDEKGRDAIASALVAAVPPSMRLALARQLPPVRMAAFDQLIDETARANATYAFTAAMAETVPVLDVPLNLADMLILTKNQLLMGYKIALAAGKSGRARDVIGEVVGVVGGGFLFRQAARSLVGLIPVAGVVPKVAVAYSGTWAIGRAVAVWATQGKKLSPSSLRRFSRDAAARGRELARSLVARRKARRLAPPSPEP